jgi:hypothetical protein
VCVCVCVCVCVSGSRRPCDLKRPVFGILNFAVSGSIQSPVMDGCCLVIAWRWDYLKISVFWDGCAMSCHRNQQAFQRYLLPPLYTPSCSISSCLRD